MYPEKKITLNKLSEKTGSPPASNFDPPVFRSSALMELLSLSAMYSSLRSTITKEEFIIRESPYTKLLM